MLRDSADQWTRVQLVDADDLPNLRATSQNVMRIGRKTDRPNLREDMALKRVLQQSGHFVGRSNDL